MLRRVACLLAAAVLATACQGRGTVVDPGADRISLLLFGGPEELAAYTAVGEAFSRSVDDTVEVEVATVGTQDDLLARLTSSFAAGTPPDVFLINFRKYGLYAEQGVLAPVQQFLDTDAQIDLDDFFPAPLEAFRTDGVLQCLPQNVSSLVTYLNEDLFTAAGVELPTGDWDWNEFKTAAGDIADQLGPDQHAIGTSASLIRLAPLVWSNGGAVVDDPDQPTALTLDTPEAIEALEFLASLVPERLAPDDLAEQGRDSVARFIAGDLAMFWSSRREVPAFREAITEFDWDVAPFPIAPDRPGHPGERVTMLHSDAFCLAAEGNVGAAWQFVEFALSADGGAPILAESGRTVPSNIEVANSAAFLREDVPPANARVFLDNAEVVRATPSTATWNEVEGQADDVLEELFFSRITLERALERLAEIRFR